MSVGGALSHTYYSLGERFRRARRGRRREHLHAVHAVPARAFGRAAVSTCRLAYNYFDLEDNIDSTNSVNPRRLQSGALSVSGSLRDDWFGGAINAASLTYAHGDLHLQNGVAAQIDAVDRARPKAASIRRCIRCCVCRT